DRSLVVVDRELHDRLALFHLLHQRRDRDLLARGLRDGLGLGHVSPPLGNAWIARLPSECKCFTKKLCQRETSLRVRLRPHCRRRIHSALRPMPSILASSVSLCESWKRSMTSRMYSSIASGRAPPGSGTAARTIGSAGATSARSRPVSRSPSARITARSIMFSSSRTLPGQG